MVIKIVKLSGLQSVRTLQKYVFAATRASVYVARFLCHVARAESKDTKTFLQDICIFLGKKMQKNGYG